jgi:hypothetical protein
VCRTVLEGLAPTIAGCRASLGTQLHLSSRSNSDSRGP